MPSSLTVCISSHISDSAPNLDQLCQSIYQISRSLVSFNVTEVVVLNDTPNAIIVASLLQFFITPPYLISETFKGVELPNKIFSKAKTYPAIPNLPAFQHHTKFKEGFTIDKVPQSWAKTHLQFESKSANGRVKPLPKAAKTTKYVQIGRAQCLELDAAQDQLQLHQRVTVDIENKKVVTPNEAYGGNNALNVYGYNVRLANKLVDVWTDTKINGGFNASGFVEGGDFFTDSSTAVTQLNTVASSPTGDILLVVGSWHKMESNLKECELEGVQLKELFDFQVNVPRHLRIEDAVTVGLSRVTM